MDKFAMIIFGASGDLTKRKLMPALYSLYRDKRLTGSFTVLGIEMCIRDSSSGRGRMLRQSPDKPVRRVSRSAVR